MSSNSFTRSPLARRLLLGLVAVCSALPVVVDPPVVLADAGESPAGPSRAEASVLAAGVAHTCAIVASGPGPGGDVQCWGSSFYGQLGQGDQVTRGDQPDEVLGLAPVALGLKAISITAGANHTCAILVNGLVKCWGQNNAGQLGLGDTFNRGDGPGEMGASLPAVSLGTGRTATMIMAGDAFTCALLDDGTVKCWGDNSSGQLFRGDTANRGDGPSEMGNALTAVPLGTTDVRGLALGAKHACAVTAETVRCWGENSSGQLGLGDNVDRGIAPAAVVAPAVLPPAPGAFVADVVTAGRAHTCASMQSAVLCWGENSDGQLGIGAIGQSRGDQPGEIGAAMRPFVMESGSVSQFSLIALRDGTCAVGGALRCWGDNLFGQLGIDSTTDVGGPTFNLTFATQVQLPGVPEAATAGQFHVCVADPTRQVLCFGANNVGQLGVGTSTNVGDQPGETAAVQPVPLRDGFAVESVAAGVAHVCALGPAGQVKCWGANSSGQLGLGNTQPVGATAPVMESLPAVQLGTGRSATAIAAGGDTSCAILDNGQVKCWGSNAFGQLGIGNAVNQGTLPAQMGDALQAVPLGAGRTAKQVSVGNRHVCAVLDNNEVKCWGDGDDGKLGQGSTARLGDNPGELDSLPPVALGTGRTAKAVAAGSDHTCAVLDDNTVKCWGRGGLLGTGDLVTRGDGAGEMGNALPVTSLGAGRTAKAIDGDSTMCVRMDNDKVKCFGFNLIGAAGVGAVGLIGDGAGETGNGLVVAEVGTGRTVTAVTSQNSNSCALLDNATVKCWGNNSATDGELGNDTSASRGTSSLEMGDNLPVVNLAAGYVPTSVTYGVKFGCVTTATKRVVCWGGNASGQLGRGDTVSIGTPTSPMSGAKPALLAGPRRLLLELPVVPGRPGRPYDINGFQGPAPGTARLTWQAPPSDNGASISGYRIETSVDEVDFSVAVADTGSSAPFNQFIVTGLPAGSRWFQVRALNAVGAGLASVSVKVDVVAVPTVPLSVTATPGDGAAAVTWSPPVSAGGVGVQISGYEVRTTPGGRTCATTVALGCTVTGLTSGVPHTFEVRAVNAFGASAWSAPSAAVTPTGPVTGAAGPVGPAVSDYVSLVPARLFDSRGPGLTVDGLFSGGGRVAAGSVTEVPVEGRGGVAGGVGAVVLNVTVVQASADGFLTLFPCGQGVPNSSNLNFAAGQTIPNAVVSKVGAGGSVCVFASAEVHLLVDVNGAFPAVSDYVSLVPARLFDSRGPGLTVDGLFSGGGRVAAGSVTEVPVEGRGGVAGGVGAVVLNVTVVQASADGFLTLFPCGQGVPNSSNLNFAAGQTIPNAVVSKVGAGGSVCVFASAEVHLLVDVNGAFPAVSDYVSLVPARLFDSRGPGLTVDGLFSGGGRVAAGSVTEVPVEGRGGVAGGVGAVVLNVTVVQAFADGFLTLFPCGQGVPNSSNLNFAAGQTIPNAVVSKVGAGGSVCVFASAEVHLLVDVNGAFPAV